MIRSTAIFSLLLLATISGFAQTSLEASVDNFVKEQMEIQKIPGVSLAVVKNGKPLIVKGYGFANIEHQVPVKPETIFQSGSVGKQFTGFAVMLLVEDGKVRLDENISKYLGEVPESWTNITVRHLLNHTSGMTDYTDAFDHRRDYTDEELLKMVKAAPLAFAPGTRHDYSNLGYLTLGFIISKAAGKPYYDFIGERIFKPLGMTTARIISEADIVPNRAAGYRLMNGEVKNQRWVSPSMNMTADGSFYFTIHDMVKWDAALTEGRLLKKSSYDAMWAPATLNDGSKSNYGFGWSLDEMDGHRLIQHGGTWQGFKSAIARFVDDKLTIIMFANLRNTDEAKLTRYIARIIVPGLELKPISDAQPSLTAGHRSLLQEITRGTIDKALFTEAAASRLFPLFDRAREQIQSFGDVEKIELVKRIETSTSRTYSYRVQYKSEVALFAVSLSNEGKIVEIKLEPF